MIRVCAKIAPRMVARLSISIVFAASCLLALSSGVLLAARVASELEVGARMDTLQFCSTTLPFRAKFKATCAPP